MNVSELQISHVLEVIACAPKANRTYFKGILICILVKHLNCNLYDERKEFYMEISKDMTIGELLEKAPEKAEILLEAGMHCLGCPASAGETIEEACAVHGIDVDEVLEKLRKI